ncbi:hypothetical protein EVAR_9922_1 [Eumeta japonica]|uniref:Uncharacterized protein n=1 Tax=Eumeta variegata TaxID=151549 RepID=A0A4C1TQS6_EUMVA|nr:hypothetical protein EVAR_9922_1 [Eumeta japonica]
MTGSILTIRTTRKSEGEPTGVVNHPRLRGICPRWTHLLPGLRLDSLLKRFILESGHISGDHFPGSGTAPMMANGAGWDTLSLEGGGNHGDPEAGWRDYAVKILPSYRSAPCAGQNSGKRW